MSVRENVKNLVADVSTEVFVDQMEELGRLRRHLFAVGHGDEGGAVLGAIMLSAAELERRGEMTEARHRLFLVALDSQGRVRTAAKSP